MDFYNAYILPRLIHWICSQNDITRVRQEIVPLAKGRVLEVGMGSGLNLPFYNPDKVDKVLGLEPSIPLREKTKEKAIGMPFDVELIGMSGEEIPLETNAVDTVLVTYSLCSIPNVSNALNEMSRVLKTGGEFIFCEHGKSPDKNIFKWQNRINPSWKKISGGCHLNRHISALIKENGFKIIDLDTKYNSPFKLVSFNYKGIAVPA